MSGDKPSNERLTGRCLCGRVRFEASRDHLGALSKCHCSQCRKFAGDAWSAFSVPFKDFRFTRGEDSVRWYRSSEFARRGFCCECGASLFYHADGLVGRKDHIAIAAGAVDVPSGLRLTEHIFTASKGDYYEIDDDLPQKEAY